METIFANRVEAGRMLAAALGHLEGVANLIVLGLPRGGVPVAFEVARTLKARLDVFLVRKLGAPGHRELAMGAVATGGVRVLDHDLIRRIGISENEIERLTEEAFGEIARREREYRGHGRRPALLEGRTVVLVDDGVATGASMLAAVRAVRVRLPARLVVAVPVAAASSVAELEPEADEVVVLAAPGRFRAVSQWYADFIQTGDEEVATLLMKADAFRRE